MSKGATTASFCAGCVLCVNFILIIAIGSYAVDKFTDLNVYKATGVEELSYVYDMGRDWDRNTFTDIRVEEDVAYGCEFGWEDMYNRVFYGVKPCCACLGRYGRYL